MKISNNFYSDKKLYFLMIEITEFANESTEKVKEFSKKSTKTTKKLIKEIKETTK